VPCIESDYTSRDRSGLELRYSPAAYPDLIVHRVAVRFAVWFVWVVVRLLALLIQLVLECGSKELRPARAVGIIVPLAYARLSG
jgi:hypothetical protein